MIEMVYEINLLLNNSKINLNIVLRYNFFLSDSFLNAIRKKGKI